MSSNQKGLQVKRRILFVDDEPFVLHGLQRMLRPLRNEWDMDFVENSQQALERMAQVRCDVIVADMIIPGLNGVQLLEEVRERYPGCIRFILSGHADQELILKCVGVAHQFLAKPCELDDLEMAIHRALNLDTALQNETLRRLISHMDRVPSIPSVYVEVIRKLRDPEVSIEEIAEVIAKDIGMTAKILKLVNSAFFGLPQEVSNTAEAVAYLGLDMIKALVLALNAFSQFETLELDGITVEDVWKHSLLTAAAAKQIAALEGARRTVLEESFAAGLLHDTGKLILAANFAGPYAEAIRRAREKRVDLTLLEQQTFGATHADVGGYLLGLWGLPVPIVDAIALHHCPARMGKSKFSPLTAVHAANVLVQEKHGSDTGSVPSHLDLRYLRDLGLSERVAIWKQALTTNAAPHWIKG